MGAADTTDDLQVALGEGVPAAGPPDESAADAAAEGAALAEGAVAESVADAVEAGTREVALRVGAAGASTGLGVDIVEIDRMEAILKRSPGFVRHTYTDGERTFCESFRNPAVRYATHFAAKEAVLKALGTGFSQGIGARDVEVYHDENGRPSALLHGRALSIAHGLGIVELALSLSRTSKTAVANAIAVTQAARPHVESELTTRDELARRFKELRGMLDEMDAPAPDAASAPPAAPDPAPDAATPAPAPPAGTPGA